MSVRPDARPPVRVRRVTTTRRGGASVAPYDEFNLGDHVGDDPEAVARNRTRLADKIGVGSDRMVWMEQIHSRNVVIVDGPRAEPIPATDALVTTVADLALVVVTADCVPVLLSDDTAGVIGAAHAGRVGARIGIIGRLLDAMVEMGADPTRIGGFLGPAASGAKYEVPADMQRDVEAHLPGSATRTERGTPGLDLRAGIRRQLIEAGVPAVAQDPALHDLRPHTVQSPSWSADRSPRIGDLDGLHRSVMSGSEPGRAADLSASLDAARDRLHKACLAADRSPDDVELLVVTKFFPASDVLTLVDLGCREFGESREPEAGRKAVEVRDAVDVPLAFHMIGQIQTKKAKTVGRWADRVHSLDTVRLADALDDAATRALDSGERSAPLDVLLQINLDGAPDRGGVVPDDLDGLADHVDALSALRLRGLMVIAPQEGTAEQWMTTAAEIRMHFVAGRPDATDFSAGMSGDLEEAVRHGSTCVRVGTAIMGSRPILSP